jgi:hypothetical protein
MSRNGDDSGAPSSTGSAEQRRGVPYGGVSPRYSRLAHREIMVLRDKSVLSKVGCRSNRLNPTYMD